jgi:CrcB protein
MLASIAGTGFCGGYTTFSTAHVESVRLWLAEGWSRGVGYAILTLGGGVAGAALGLVVGSQL